MATRSHNQAIKNCQAWDDLDNAGGIIAYSAWNTGSGKYKKARDIPPHCAVWIRAHSKFTEQLLPTHVKQWFRDHPRAKRCVAFLNTDLQQKVKL